MNGKRFSPEAFLASLGGKEDRIHVRIPEARQCLEGFMRREVGDRFQWLPEYDEVAEWLTDNRGKSLLCVGNNGRGKTLICSKAIPAILNYFMGKVVYCCDATSMAANAEMLRYASLISIDDIGTEPVASDYGSKLYMLPEIADEAEKRGKMLLLTSNLSAESLTEKYGRRTFDRLRGLCEIVVSQGGSMRRK